jgi:DNA-directed RNA polymerase subunit K/omega
MEITPVDLRKIDQETKNVYEAVIVASKRARQLNDEVKIEFNAVLSTIPAGPSDENGEDVSNPAQMKISLEFEKREKPHLKALNELLDSKVEYEYKNK